MVEEGKRERTKTHTARHGVSEIHSHRCEAHSRCEGGGPRLRLSLGEGLGYGKPWMGMRRSGEGGRPKIIHLLNTPSPPALGGQNRGGGGGGKGGFQGAMGRVQAISQGGGARERGRKGEGEREKVGGRVQGHKPTRK